MLPIVRIVPRNRQRRERNLRLIAARKTIREQNDPFRLPEVRFIELFRVDKELARYLIAQLTPHLDAPRSRRGITAEKKVMVAMRFYATGSYQRCVGEEYNCGLSQASVHFCIHEVTNVIVRFLAPQYIKFPDTIAQRNNIKAKFMNKFGFPGVVGAIDGTHIAILKPIHNEQNFINRKGYHSINCQIVCDAKLKILNIFANFGGSTHDSFIWNQSQLKTYLERNQQQGEAGWVIGDSGYPQSPILMTPFINPLEGTPQARYNNAHIRARNTIERCIGVLKMRFRCLLKERTARYRPEFVCGLIKCCAVLHNMCIDRHMHLEGEENVENDGDVPQPQVGEWVEELTIRQRIVQRYFG